MKKEKGEKKKNEKEKYLSFLKQRTTAVTTAMTRTTTITAAITPPCDDAVINN